jgi:hypothetical protein
MMMHGPANLKLITDLIVMNSVFGKKRNSVGSTGMSSGKAKGTTMLQGYSIETPAYTV